MAVYRQVHVSFWQDPDILEYTPEEKYFYLYLMTNSKTTQCGIYEIPKKIMELETGYNRETIEKLLNRFIEYGKILYDSQTKEIMIVNWIKYNWSKSEKVVSCIRKELAEVKSSKLLEKFKEVVIQYGYSMDTLPIEWGEEKEKEKEKEEKEEKELIPYADIVDYLNEKAGTQYRHTSKKTRDLIKARHNEGFSLVDFKTVIDKKTASWLNSDMAKYLRPETLFGTKFEGYLNEIPSAPRTDKSHRIKVGETKPGKGKYEDFYLS